MKPPITYYGGKQYLLDELLKRIPPHLSYVEVFGGSGGLLFAKEPAKMEVYNDIDSKLVNLYRVLQDKTMHEELLQLLKYTPYSREIYEGCTSRWNDDDGMVRNAWKFYVVNEQGAGYSKSDWRVRTKTIPFQNQSLSWHNKIHTLDETIERLKNVLIENRTWQNIVERFDTPHTFFYLDPPYVLSTRLSKSKYAHEMTDADHEALIERIQTLTGKVLLSGYHNPIYDKLGWKYEEFDVFCNSSAKPGDRRTEVLWRNYDLPQMELF